MKLAVRVTFEAITKLSEGFVDVSVPVQLEKTFNTFAHALSV